MPAKAAPIAAVPRECGRAGLRVREMMTPLPCATIRLAAQRAVMNWVVSTSRAARNCFTGSSVAGVPVPYSLTRGPAPLNSISIPPARWVI